MAAFWAQLKKYMRRYPLLVLVTLVAALAVGFTTALANYNMITVRASVLNVRQGPGLSYNVMAQVSAGQHYTILDQRNDWYQIRLDNNRIGWVASWLVDNTEVSQATNRVGLVTVNEANIRQSADTSAPVVGTAKSGQKVTILYQANGWSQVLVNNSAGWMRNDTLKMTDEVASTVQTNGGGATQVSQTAIKTVTTQQTAYLRSGPSDSSSVVTSLAANTTLTYRETTGQWYQVETKNGQKGYVASWLVSLSANDTAAKTVPTKLSEATIMLDPGHGGSDSGAIANDGTGFEKKYTLETAKIVANSLRAAGAKVILTRTTDTFVDLAPRAAMSNKDGVDAYISIHFDSAPTANQASGFTTYYYNSGKDLRLAKSLSSALGSTLPLTNKGVAYGNFEVLRDNAEPSVLLELGYINNDTDYKEIRSTDYQQQAANAITQGLLKYFQ
ncbi:N-acetylmuramoyl-L-alanine amidase [Schleiferilactobacillus shenzhenensis]|uniref:LytH n=1 Tax=Schleiferilactobacillus shenzhenensis LY-73 TaxID=1231336 RepID=U4TY65_9LACO|nr:N-acetylmuramoyl-L-alanine amidase [Schleiferilactobacillus shenzhenensis]ERL66743.1 LytH [Schleiferilactobacillus shenzhenensis LY-73]